MSFDFHSFRRLLYQNALEDAIQVLSKHDSGGYGGVAASISSQLNAWQKSSRWNLFRHTKQNKYHEAIVRNLYQCGVAASKNEPPPDLTSIHPWRPIVLGYLGTVAILWAGFFFLTYTPECPSFERGRQVPIIIDRFVSYNEPFFQSIGLKKNTFENFIKGQLSLDNVSAAVHPVRVNTLRDAKRKCKECGARMIIWGQVDYRGNSMANLDYYLDHESYESYILKHGIPEAEEPFKGIFDIKTRKWIGEVTCLVGLFQGLMAKEKYQTATTPKEKKQAIETAERLFEELTHCAIDDSLKLFALHCLAWTKMSQQDEKAALVTYNRILEINANDALALNNSALLYEKQNNYLYANIRYAQLLEKNEIPYIRIAKAEALTKLNRKEEANEEIKQVKDSPEYRRNKEVYDRKINTLPASSFDSNGGVTQLAPSVYLSHMATKLNQGDTRGTIRGLDSLSARVDTTTFSKEDILVMRELYKSAGANDKAVLLNAKAVELGVKVPTQNATMIRAIRRERNK